MCLLSVRRTARAAKRSGSRPPETARPSHLHAVPTSAPDRLSPAVKDALDDVERVIGATRIAHLAGEVQWERRYMDLEQVCAALVHELEAP